MEIYEFSIPERFLQYEPSVFTEILKFNLANFLKTRQQYKTWKIAEQLDSTSRNLVVTWHPTTAIKISLDDTNSSLKVESINEHPRSISNVKIINNFVEHFLEK